MYLPILVHERIPGSVKKTLIDASEHWAGFELTPLGTDFLGSCKSNYHTITITTAPWCSGFKSLFRKEHKFIAKHLNLILLNWMFRCVYQSFFNTAWYPFMNQYGEIHCIVVTCRRRLDQWPATGRWISPGTPASSTNKTDSHDISWNIVESGVKQHNPKYSPYTAAHIRLAYFTSSQPNLLCQK
jgi:hypothetical protein